jgi:flagellar biosynthesis protein FlhG
MVQRRLGGHSIHDAAKRSGVEECRIRYYESHLADVFSAAGIDVDLRDYDERRIDLIREIDGMLTRDRVPLPEIRRQLGLRFSRGRGALNVIAVTSGKGGVGKTTISINLAVSLARQGLRTLLVDADLGLANVHVYAGLTPRGTLVDVVSGRATLEEVVENGIGNVKVVCGDSAVARMADLSRQMTEYLGNEVARLASSFDVIVVDTAAGVSAQVVEFLQVADQVVLVATPNLASTLDAYGVVKVARQQGLHEKMNVLVNQVKDRKHSEEVFRKIGGCAQKFLGYAPHYLGYLFQDEMVEASNNQRRPLVISDPTHRNAVMFRDLAAALMARHHKTRQAATPVMSAVAS